jgi:hypothetical protein
MHAYFARQLDEPDLRRDHEALDQRDLCESSCRETRTGWLRCPIVLRPAAEKQELSVLLYPIVSGILGVCQGNPVSYNRRARPKVWNVRFMSNQGEKDSGSLNAPAR